MRVVRLHNDPEVLLLYDFVSEAEARALIDGAHFERSPTVCEKSEGCVVAERTSSSAAVGSSPTTEALQARGKVLSRLPMAETLQVVRYEPGQEYKPHLDAFDGSEGGRNATGLYGGRQREATILIYLDGPEEGGETVFPELGLKVAPIPRAALFWRNVRPDGTIDHRTLHGGAPVHRGVKYAANLWLRGEKDPVYAYALSEGVVPPSAPENRKGSVAIVALGVGLGAIVGGPPGALLGGAVGWTAAMIRRSLTA